jgi:tetratricopeptide (TPR) repeat protein
MFGSAFAQTPFNNPEKNIHHICVTSPTNCLQHVTNIIEGLPKNSRRTFDLLQYKYDSLFNLQRRKQLHTETKQWLDTPNLPRPFLVTVYIYYAKTSWHFGQKETSKKYALLAKDELSTINQVFPSPMRLVELANLEMHLKNFSEAYQQLSQLKVKYKNSQNAHFNMELNGNLAHAANQLGYTEEALTHWLESKKWSLLFGNQQQLGIVLFNLADIYFQLEQYPLAEEAFNQSITISTAIGDTNKANQAKLHLAENKIRQKKYCQADQLINFVKKHPLPLRDQKKLKQVSNLLKPCK